MNENGIFPDIPLIIPVLSTVFKFDNMTVKTNTNISELPRRLFDSTRNQYRSDHLLSWLQQTLKPSNSTKLLAICAFDSYFGNFNFCFGEAIIGGRVAAIYLKRLLPPDGTTDKKSLNLFQERIVKEGIHEIGHTFGLRHCSHNHCIMFKSKTILDTDKKNREFCESCLNSLTISIQSP